MWEARVRNDWLNFMWLLYIFKDGLLTTLTEILVASEKRMYTFHSTMAKIMHELFTVCRQV